MREILNSALPFLAILNPFAVCLYLAGVMEDLSTRDFIKVFSWSSMISLFVFWIFMLSGEHFLITVLGVRPAALRIFGGLIFLVVGYNYATKGYRAAEMLRGKLDELPSAIALPYMIGAATITQSIIIGKNNSTIIGTMILIVSIAVTFTVVILFKFIRDKMQESRGRIFDRYINILSRINGLIIGTISTDMIVSGIHQIWITG